MEGKPVPSSTTVGCYTRQAPSSLHHTAVMAYTNKSHSSGNSYIVLTLYSCHTSTHLATTNLQSAPFLTVGHPSHSFPDALTPRPSCSGTAIAALPHRARCTVVCAGVLFKATTIVMVNYRGCLKLCFCSIDHCTGIGRWWHSVFTVVGGDEACT